MSVKFWCAVAALVFIIGCGGGGGGGNSGGGGQTVPAMLGGCVAPGVTTTLNYSTSWGAAPASSSELIELIGSDGSVVRTDLLNRAAGNSISLSTVSGAIYSMRVKLYGSPNATGTQLGVSQQTVDLCAGRATDPVVSVSTQNSGTPDSTYLSISGSASASGGGYTIIKGLTARLFPTVLSKGQAVFYNPALLSIVVTGGIGTVDASQVFTATTAGSGTVKAAYPGAAPQQPLNLTVTNQPNKSKWTVLVYMNAANDLYTFSPLNFNQLEVAAAKPDQVRMVVQWKQSTSAFPGSSFDGTRRYLVNYDTTSAINSQVLASNMTEPDGSPLDMGNASNLLDFVKWGKATYPADRYCLVVWNHGNGWRTKTGMLNLPVRGFSYDDQSHNAIQTWQIPAALGSEHLDIFAWDCSLMQMSEVAYELRNNADYIVGSEESPPGEGYPYDTIFGAFRDNASQDTATLSKNFVDKTLAVPAYATRKITQSVLRSSALNALATAVSNLGQQLEANAAVMTPVATTIRGSGQGYSVFPNYRYFYDLVDVCDRIDASGAAPTSVTNATAAVRTAVANAMVYEGHNSESPGSHGIAIDLSPQSYVPTMISDYRKMQFATATQWDEWLVSQQ